MEFKAYKLLYYCNAQHSMDNTEENAHSHTFSIGLYIEDQTNEKLLDLNKVDHIVNNFLEPFRGRYLNEKNYFQNNIPTIEHMGNMFYEDLKEILIELNYDLIQLDISENPLHIYSISDRMYVGRK